MLGKGQYYHKDGIIYKVKDFSIKTFHIKVTLINESNNTELKISTTVTDFVSAYSKLPDAGVELVKESPS